MPAANISFLFLVDIGKVHCNFDSGAYLIPTNHYNGVMECNQQVSIRFQVALLLDRAGALNELIH